MPLSLTEEEELELLELEEAEEAEQAAASGEKPVVEEETYNPTDGTGNLQRLREGIGSGMVKGARGMGNLAVKATNVTSPLAMLKMLAGHANKPEGFFSDEAIEEQSQLDAPLRDTGAGMIGGMIGETAVTAPIGAGTGKGMMALGNASRAAPGALSKLGWLSSKPAIAAVEGAISSAATADPDSQLASAGLGAVAGPLLSKMGDGVSRLFRGLVKPSQAAQDLEHIAGQLGGEIDLPLAAYASEDDILSRLAKSTYRDALPMVPTVQGQLAKQNDDALAQFRKLAIGEASPDGVNLPDNIGSDAGQAKNILKRGFDAGYDDTVKQFDFMVPKTFRADAMTKIRSAVKNVDDVSANKAATDIDMLMQRYSNGKSRIEGENLLDIKYEMSELIGKAKGKEKQALIAASNQVEDLIKLRLTPQGLYKKYTDLAEPYANFKSLQKAMRSAKSEGGNFSPKQLARAAKEGSSLDALAQAGQQSIGHVGGRNNAVGKALTGSALGGYAYFIDPITALKVVGGSKLLATKTAQKLLMGKTDTQKALVEALRKNPRIAEQLGRVGRTAVTTQLGGDDE